MRMRIESHLHAETILEGEYAEEWEELKDVLGTTDVPLRPVAPFSATGRPMSPKRQRRRLGGSDRFVLLPIDQPVLNATLDLSLRSRGWTSQPFAVEGVPGDALPTFLQGDFSKRKVFVEVEFGNTASLFRDLFKFQIAGRSGAGEVGVLVVAVDSVARLFDSGVATFESATRLLPFMRIGIQLPVAVVGLDLGVSDWDRVARRYDEMRHQAEANGVSCHPFEAVRRAPTTPD